MSLVATGEDGHGAHEENGMPDLEKEVKLIVSAELKDFWQKVAVGTAAVVAALLFGTFMIVNSVATSKAEGTEKFLSGKIDGVEKTMNVKFDNQEKIINAKIDGLEKKIDARFDAQQAILADIQKKLTK